MGDKTIEENIDRGIINEAAEIAIKKSNEEQAKVVEEYGEEGVEKRWIKRRNGDITNS